MSWNNCRKCVSFPRNNSSSVLLKVLLSMKILHGGRQGAKGSTLEDIAMYMIKHFSLDGDIKSQVLASLKYGVKMHYIEKRKEKFALIIPASSIFLAPCKFKEEETERIQCLYPPTWESNACSEGSCRPGGGGSCCGSRKRGAPNVCCHKGTEDDNTEDPYGTSKSKRSKTTCKCTQQTNVKPSCTQCQQQQHTKKSQRNLAPCPKPKPPVCSRKRGKRERSESDFDNYCQSCSYTDEDDTSCNPGLNYEAYKNCSCCDN